MLLIDDDKMDKTETIESTLQGGGLTPETYETDFTCYDVLRDSVGSVINDNLPEDLNFHKTEVKKIKNSKKTTKKTKKSKSRRKRS